MYLFLSCISFFIVIFITINYLLLFVSGISDKKKIYSVKDNNKQYFWISLFLSFSKPFEIILKKLNINIVSGYILKIDNILKILSCPYTNFNAYNFIVLQLFCMFTGIIMSLLLFGGDIIIVFCSGILFFILPYLKIYEERNKKINSIIKQLPNLSDLLSVMIVSGIDFYNSIVKISFILQGTLNQELKNIISKVSLGDDIKYALKETAEKYNIEQLTLFVRAVNSSLESGLAMSETLNKISEQIKIENAAAAEKKAHEAPVKMLIPMTFLILPTIFILLFAPMIISFIKNGSLF